ncbi:DMT family transporter [Evansella sp. LMS18]|jgi:drug/metabolite transporter (DMT)-like permease|uniref:DMT family transporter n=1 Tax=Evansella sp. LMS18 TaxID=2924033 RepID=UPI0020D0ABDE|nr:DMT family transporter [Evansella sp. LMS18]UTR10548.1 DMT family transporter [Evansella sp. LMS18]
MGYLLAFMSAFCYSVTNIVLKKGMRHSEENGVWIITFINAVFLGLIFILSLILQTSSPSINLHGIVLFTTAGILINFVGRTLLYSGIRKIGASKAVAIKNSAPVFTLLFAVFIIKEQISLGPWVGIILIIVGMFLLGLHLFKEDTAISAGAGYWVALYAAAAYGIGQGLSKQGINSLDNPFFGVFIGAVAAFLILSLIEAYRGNLKNQLGRVLDGRSNHYIAAGVLTSLALLFFYLSISYIHVSYTVAILAADPVFTVILSNFFLKKEESITKLLITVAVLVFIGAGIISVMGG